APARGGPPAAVLAPPLAPPPRHYRARLYHHRLADRQPGQFPRHLQAAARVGEGRRVGEWTGEMPSRREPAAEEAPLIEELDPHRLERRRRRLEETCVGPVRRLVEERPGRAGLGYGPQQPVLPDAPGEDQVSNPLRPKRLEGRAHVVEPERDD